MKVLVIAAHPDDEVLGCGATAARLVMESQEVHVAILGEGITSRHRDPNDVDSAQLAALQAQAHAAAAKLGVKSLVLHKLPDNRLDTVPLLEVVKIVEDLVQRLKPEVIYTHHGGDLNIDHGVTHRAVLTATRPLAGQPVREIYAFEVPSSTEWAFQRLEPSFRPNVFVDVSRTLEAKIAAMQCYESEARQFPHPRSPEALRALAMRWGSVAGCAAAEAFELVRSVRPQLG
ncbi:MAG TPA: PIG-L deacetylase family protein [Candidatus Sulfotelmatobacter sp.]|nr:PIG-L deacetylase family protein [Candidatus Sulfotelmatobacter sp.]